MNKKKNFVQNEEMGKINQKFRQKCNKELNVTLIGVITIHFSEN